MVRAADIFAAGDAILIEHTASVQAMMQWTAQWKEKNPIAVTTIHHQPFWGQCRSFNGNTHFLSTFSYVCSYMRTNGVCISRTPLMVKQLESLFEKDSFVFESLNWSLSWDIRTSTTCSRLVRYLRLRNILIYVRQALLDGEQAWTSILNLKSFVICLDFAVHAHCTIRMECTMLHWFLNQ